MFARIFGRPTAFHTARRIKRKPAIETLEGRQLMSLGAEFLVSTPTPAAQFQPVNASSSNGSSVAVWSQQTSTNSVIMGQLFNAQGGKVGPVLTLARGVNVGEEEPSVAMDAHGDFVVSWTQFSPNSNSFVLAQKFNAVGSPVGGVVPVATGTFAQTDSSVGMDAHGDFVVSYTRDTNNNNDDIFAKLYNTNGQLLTVDTVAGTFLQEVTSSVAMSPGGQFDVTWLTEFNGTANEVNAAQYTASGTLIESRTILDGGDFSLPKIAIDNTGNAVIAFQSSINGTSKVEARRLSDAGALGNLITIANNASEPSVALEGNAGAYVVAYESGTSSDVSEVNSSDVVISTSSLGQSRFVPTVSINAQNEFLVTYIGQSGNDTFIAGRRGLL